MRIYPKPLEIGDEEGFTPEKDFFGRSAFASNLIKLVTEVEDPLVLALDGPWGSGKTTFLKMWAGELRKSGHTVIYFDAFENDYIEDAFSAIAGEIIAEIEKVSNKNEVARSVREKAIDLGVLVARGAARVGTKAVIRLASGGLAADDDLKAIADDVFKEIEGVSESCIVDFISKPKKYRLAVREFKNSISDLAKRLSNDGDNNKKLVIIIDELDRCNPKFSLDILERIKHLFSVENVHFVLGVQMEQFYNSIKNAYGNDIDSKLYLQKFINLTISISELDGDRRPNVEKYIKYLLKTMNFDNVNDAIIRDSVDTINRIIYNKKLSLRTAERAITALMVSIYFTPKDRLRIGSIIGGLIMMRLLRLDLFRDAKNGLLKFQNAAEFLDLDMNNITIEYKWWEYSLTGNLRPDFKEVVDKVKFDFDLNSHSYIVSNAANCIIDLVFD